MQSCAKNIDHFGIMSIQIRSIFACRRTDCAVNPWTSASTSLVILDILLPIRHTLSEAERRSVPATIDVNQVLQAAGDRKSTRLNSSHSSISYAVFCLKKK